jgi:hypothetical protein
MSDGELTRLQDDLRELGRRCLGEIPNYGVYLRDREPFRNRVITVLRDRDADRILAFSAMLLWHIKLGQHRRLTPVMHLGLVLVAPELRGKKTMYAIYHEPLVRYLFRRAFRPLWITSTTMEPVIAGSVADGFSRVYPHYVESASRLTPVHSQIARTFVRDHGHEIGIWEGATFDEEHFVIRGSSRGACQALMRRFEDTAGYRMDACNVFCRDTLDYSQGDEILQVGRLDLPAIARSAWWMLARAKRRLGVARGPVGPAAREP